MDTNLKGFFEYLAYFPSYTHLSVSIFQRNTL